MLFLPGSSAEPASCSSLLLNRPVAHHRTRRLLQYVRVLCAALPLVVCLDQHTVFPRFVGLAAHTDQVPAPLELFAFESEGETALLEALIGVAFRKPPTAIPDQDDAGAIRAFRNGPLERVVVNRVIFDLYRKPLGAGNEARPFGDRPALHHPTEFEAQIVMQPTRGVLLEDVLVAFATIEAPAWLGGQVKFSLPMVNFKAQDAPLGGALTLFLRPTGSAFLEVPYHLRPVCCLSAHPRSGCDAPCACQRGAWFQPDQILPTSKCVRRTGHGFNGKTATVKVRKRVVTTDPLVG